MMEIEELYRTYKPLLFSLAYHMLGCVSDAEDIVHEVFLDFHPHQRTQMHVRSYKAYLCKMVTNRCIDYLRLARVKREVYVGPWLPEPLVASQTAEDPSQRFLQKETLSTAFLLMLQRLSPIERAVFVYREVLAYEYDEISGIVDKSMANCRQIAHRAVKKLSYRETTWTQASTSATTNALVERFVQALVTGDMEQLAQVLAPDAVMYTDGGGKVHAAVRPIIGRDRLLLFFANRVRKDPGLHFRFAEVNYTPGLILYLNENVYSVLTFHVENDTIQALYSVLNPDKFGHLTT